MYKPRTMAKNHIYFHFEPEVNGPRLRAMEYFIGTLNGLDQKHLQFHLEGAVKDEVYEVAAAIMKNAEARGIELTNPIT